MPFLSVLMAIMSQCPTTVFSFRNVTLLDHTTPGSLSLATTYTISGIAFGDDIAFSPDGNYIAVGHSGTPGLTLLDHTTPGSLSLATTYSLSTAGGVSFSPDGLYLAVGHTLAPYFTLLDHSTPGSLSVAATYTLSDDGQGNAFSPN